MAPVEVMLGRIVSCSLKEKENLKIPRRGTELVAFLPGLRWGSQSGEDGAENRAEDRGHRHRNASTPVPRAGASMVLLGMPRLHLTSACSGVKRKTRQREQCWAPGR